MPNKMKIDYNKLTFIEIYELVLQDRIPCFPSGFWFNRNNEQAKEIAILLLRYLLNDKLKLNKQEILNTVSKKFLTQNKLHTASKLFGRSAIKYVMSAYPGEFQPWQFKNDKVPQSYWTDENNRISAIRYVVESELEWSIQDVKENLNWDILEERGLATLHTYYSNLFKLINASYPDTVQPWEVMNSEVPNGTWEEKYNRILAIKWLITKVNYPMNKIDRKTFADYGLSKLLDMYYCTNPKKAMAEVFANDINYKIHILNKAI